MPGTTPLQLYAYPLTTDQAAPSGIQTVAQAVEKQVVAVFADTATRDSRWTAATGLANGAVCFINATGELQLRSGGAWVVIGGRASSFAMAAATVAWTTSGSASAYSTAVTFTAGRFSAAPIVTAVISDQTGSSSKCIVRVASIATTGFSAVFSSVDATNIPAGTYTGQWQAAQMTSAAAAG